MGTPALSEPIKGANRADIKQAWAIIDIVDERQTLGLSEWRHCGGKLNKDGRIGNDGGAAIIDRDK